LEVVGAVNVGFNKAVRFLRGELGATGAADWWRQEGSRNAVPALGVLFAAAEARSRGVELPNLLADPGFELAAGPALANEPASDLEVLLEFAEAARLGVRHWFPERTPYRYALTAAAHSGRRALLIAHSYRARFSRNAPATPGARYRVSVWFKHDGGSATYRFAMNCRLTDGTYAGLVALPIPWRPGEWQELAVDVQAPPTGKTLLLQLGIDQQAPDARCWIDDAFIGRYPE
jgi:hypothetical protein